MSGNVPAPDEKSLQRIVRSIRDLFEGRRNAQGQFTMALNAATTVVVAPNCGDESKITLTPRHANAATEFGAGTWYISSIGPGTFTVTHVNSATGNRTFDYAIHG